MSRFCTFYPVHSVKGLLMPDKTKSVVPYRKNKLVMEDKHQNIVGQLSYDDSMKLDWLFDEGVVRTIYIRAMSQWYQGSQPCQCVIRVKGRENIRRAFTRLGDLGYRCTIQEKYPWGTTTK